MIEGLDSVAITQTLQPIRTHLDDILVTFKQVEVVAAALRFVVPHEALDFLVLSWHHEHLGDQSGSKKKRYHQSERDFWLACATGLLEEDVATLKALVFDKLDSIVRASSLVEMVNSLIRPSLNSCKGQITQETLNLIMFYHNHRRYKSGKRQGKAPIELLTGKPLEAPWWELLLQHTQGTSQDPSLTSSSPLALVSHSDEPTTPSQIPLGPEALAPSTESTLSWSPMDAEAA